ncbi:MAG: hypothetical protein IPJ12_00915 [Betaproteobacteria bacterium]|nr:hypothetical protein [Betaproteobacteria bacterium]
MLRWNKILLGAFVASWGLGGHAAEIGIAAFNIAWSGSEADFNERIRVCNGGLVNWCDTRAKIAKGDNEPTSKEEAASSGKRCRMEIPT